MIASSYSHCCGWIAAGVAIPTRGSAFRPWRAWCRRRIRESATALPPVTEHDWALLAEQLERYLMHRRLLTPERLTRFHMACIGAGKASRGHACLYAGASRAQIPPCSSRRLTHVAQKKRPAIPRQVTTGIARFDCRDVTANAIPIHPKKEFRHACLCARIENAACDDLPRKPDAPRSPRGKTSHSRWMTRMKPQYWKCTCAISAKAAICTRQRIIYGCAERAQAPRSCGVAGR